MPAQSQSESSQITGPKWLVRGADGSLYVISVNNPPQKLTGDAATAAKDILSNAERELSDKIPEKMSTLASGVSLAITEAFGHS